MLELNLLGKLLKNKNGVMDFSMDSGGSQESVPDSNTFGSFLLSSNKLPDWSYKNNY